MIRRHPYGLPIYILLAQEYLCLEYPDLAAGAAYKALLLSDAVQDEDDEFHERAVDAFFDLMSDLASEGERQVFYARHGESPVQDNAEDNFSQLKSIVTRHYLPRM